ncbi:MAG: hypothetical protein GWN29_04925 [Gammaproteobacteria bacterium]|nr:hypothetical protein [Gammaproteobacteria bacterium]NIV51097.1 hypothetical protein [Gammaproteobacteria bacterium]NIW23949.1 hypothetical protein [Gammaproteobacteria bacterium]NIX85039.1 hypothetical protein [Gammaproteobacteria bacterium]
MARTAITLTSIADFASGGNLTGTTGDQANGMVITNAPIPRVGLIVSSTHSSTVIFTIRVAASIATFKRGPFFYPNGSYTVPAAVGSVEGKLALILDHPAWLDAGDININSSDSNLNLCTFYAYTWTPTWNGA